MGSMEGQGGSADTRGTASCDGLTEPLRDSVLTRPLGEELVAEVVVIAAATAGAAEMVGGLCRVTTGLCLALGDLLSLRAVTGDVVA